MGMVQKATVSKDSNFEDDPVLKDLRENFREPTIHGSGEKNYSTFRSHLARMISIGILLFIALLYILARVGL